VAVKDQLKAPERRHLRWPGQARQHDRHDQRRHDALRSRAQPGL